MRQSRGKSFWVALVALVALIGTIGCLGDSGPPVLAIRPQAEDRSKSAAKEDHPAPIAPVVQPTLETRHSAIAIPDTPDGTVRAVFQGLREGHPEVVWDALPASYQRDLNDLVRLAANRLNPEAWRYAQKIVGKGARIAMVCQQRIPNQVDSADEDASAERQTRALQIVATVLERFANGGSRELERLKTADLGEILQADGQTVWQTATDFLAVLSDEFPKALQQSLLVDVTVQDIAGDSAVLEIGDSLSNGSRMEFVRIEGKWIPRSLAEQWAAVADSARQAVVSALPSEIASDNFGVTFQALAWVEFSVDAWATQIEHPKSDPDSLYGLCGNFWDLRQALMMIGYLMGGPPTVEPDFNKKLRQESLTTKGKVTLVYCYAPKELKFDNETVDYDLAKHVAAELSANKIKVVDSEQVYTWLDKNWRWKKPAEIGAAFGVDYIVHIDLLDYSLFEANSTYLNRGRADGIINVIKMDAEKKDGIVIYTKAIKSNFPTRGPIDSASMPFNEFKKRYLCFLSAEIGRLFHQYEPDADSP